MDEVLFYNQYEWHQVSVYRIESDKATFDQIPV